MALIDTLTSFRQYESGALTNVYSNGYVLDGLYLDSDYQTPLSATATYTKDLSVYAKWNYIGVYFEEIQEYNYAKGEWENFYTIEKIDNDSNIGTLTIADACNYLEVRRIEQGVHLGEGTINKLILPSTLEEIPDNTFANSNINEIVVGDDSMLTSISFTDCNAKITLSANNQNYAIKNNILFSAVSNEILCLVGTPYGDVVVPDEISYIGTMFANSNITSIRIPSSVLEIEDGAFENCAQLKWVIIDDKGITQEDGVSTIGDDAFKNCSALKYIVLPACLKTIGANAFFGCSLDSLYYHDKSYAWSSITQTDSCLTGNVYYFSLKEQTLETYYSNIEWHYDNNGNPVTWLTVKNNLKGKTFTVTDAVATVSDFYWESIVAAKTQNALTPDLVDAKFYEAAMSSNTKEEFESALGQIYANQLGIAKFGTSGIVLVTNELGEDVSYTYVELNDRIFMKPYGHSNYLQGTFYVDQNGNVYEIQNAKKLLGYETITVKYIYTETPN